MSCIFKDSEGREWYVKLTVGSVDRVLDLCQVDLYEQDDWAKVLKDPRIACAVLGAVLIPEIEKRQLTIENFRDSLDGDAAFAGIAALHEAIVNFTPPALRATRKKILDKVNETIEEQAKLEQQRLSSGVIDRLVRAQLQAENDRISRELESKLANLSGEHQDSLESTHAT